MEVSIYKKIDINPDHPDAQGMVIHIDRFFGWVKNGIKNYENTLFQIRNTESKADRDALKLTLPAITLSGVFHPTRAISNLVKHSLLIGLDLDGNDTQQISDIKKFIEQNCPHVYTSFYSASCKGLCVVFPVLPTQNQTPYITPFDHKRYYVAANRYLEAIIPDELKQGIKFDSTNDVTRPRYLSYDPTLHINTSAKPFTELATDLVEYTQESGGYADGVLPVEIDADQTYQNTVEMYTRFAGDFGLKGARHDWVRGLFVWLNRAGVNMQTALTKTCLYYPIPDRRNWEREHKRTAEYVYNQNRGEFGSRLSVPVVVSTKGTPKDDLKQLIENKIVSLNSYKARQGEKASKIFMEKAQQEIDALINILERL